jgi:hypothetical protein
LDDTVMTAPCSGAAGESMTAGNVPFG